MHLSIRRAPAREATKLSADPRKPAVLLVEDDPDTRTLVSLVLRKEYEVETAATAEEARRKLAATSSRFRLVVLDLMLGGSDEGFALARDIRTSRRWRTIPVIVASALTREADQRRARAAGVDEYLTKPFYPRDLLSIVERYAPPKR